MAATGEQVSVGLLALALQAQGLQAVSYGGWQVPIVTDSAYTKARISSIADDRVRADLAAGKVVVITGFQGIDAQGNVTTLGRGGSDTSAVAVAAALKADECLIYTDVDGVYTTDPRIVPEARRLASISFEEMLEMASLGSKVLQIRSVEFAGKYRVPLRVLSSFTPWDIPLDEEARSGTLITFEEDEKMEQAVVCRHRVQPRRGQDQRHRRARPAGHRATRSWGRWPRPTSTSTSSSRTSRTTAAPTSPSPCTRNDYARTMDVLKTKVQPAIGAARADAATRRSARSASSASACAATSAWRARCSARSPRRASTSR